MTEWLFNFFRSKIKTKKSKSTNLFPLRRLPMALNVKNIPVSRLVTLDPNILMQRSTGDLMAWLMIGRR